MVHHVDVSSEVMSKDELETMNEGKSLTVEEVKGANVKADVECGRSVHVVDKVLMPAFSVPADIRSPQDILALSTDPTKPSGWAPEVLNGVAMLGFVMALYGENYGRLSRNSLERTLVR